MADGAGSSTSVVSLRSKLAIKPSVLGLEEERHSDVDEGLELYEPKQLSPGFLRPSYRIPSPIQHRGSPFSKETVNTSSSSAASATSSKISNRTNSSSSASNTPNPHTRRHDRAFSDNAKTFSSHVSSLYEAHSPISHCRNLFDRSPDQDIISSGGQDFPSFNMTRLSLPSESSEAGDTVPLRGNRPFTSSFSHDQTAFRVRDNSLQSSFDDSSIATRFWNILSFAFLLLI